MELFALAARLHTVGCIEIIDLTLTASCAIDVRTDKSPDELYCIYRTLPYQLYSVNQ